MAPEQPRRGLRVDALCPAPADEAAWIRECLARDVQDEAELEVLEQQIGHSVSGWPMRMYLTEVWPAKALAAAWPEIRIHAFYEFLDYGGHAMAFCAADGTDEDVQKLMDILASARPDFSGPEVVALCQLWE